MKKFKFKYPETQEYVEKRLVTERDRDIIKLLDIKPCEIPFYREDTVRLIRDDVKCLGFNKSEEKFLFDFLGCDRRNELMFDVYFLPK